MSGLKWRLARGQAKWPPFPDVRSAPGGRLCIASGAMAEPNPKQPPQPLPPRVAAALVFLASGAVLVLEIVGLRLVGPYVGVTLQTSTGVIGIALAAIAYGAWMGGWLADRTDPRRLIAPALLLGAVATALVPS